MLDEAVHRDVPDDRIRRLSSREFEVLEMVSLGLTNAQLAERLR